MVSPSPSFLYPLLILSPILSPACKGEEIENSSTSFAHLTNLVKHLPNCIIVHLSNSSSAPNPSSTSQQMLFVHLGSQMDRAKALLRREALCAIIVLDEDEEKHQTLPSFYYTVFTDSQVTIIRGKQYFGGIAADLKRPLLWESEDQLQLFCPKTGRPRRPTIRRLPKSVKAFVKHDLSCPTPMLNQELTFGFRKALPGIIQPGMFGNGALSGFNANFAKTLAKHFRSSHKIEFDVPGQLNLKNMTYLNGFYGKVMKGQYDLTIGNENEHFNQMFDMSIPFASSQFVYVTRLPQPKLAFGQSLKPFAAVVWLLLLASLLFFSACMFVTYKIYTSNSELSKLVKPEKHPSNFLIFPLAKMTEPDPLHWFDKTWSSGRLLTFLWSILCFFMVAFYTCNLRAHLTTVDLEESPTTLEHIVKRGNTVHSLNIVYLFRRTFLEGTGRAGTVLHQIAVLSEETGGVLKAGITNKAAKDVMDSGAFLMVEDLLIPYQYKRYPLLTRENLYVVDEPLGAIQRNYLLQKDSPARPYVDKVIRRLVEGGVFSKWLLDHLPMRSVLKPKPDATPPETMELRSFYDSMIFYSTAVSISLVVLVWELRRTVKAFYVVSVSLFAVVMASYRRRFRTVLRVPETADCFFS